MYKPDDEILVLSSNACMLLYNFRVIFSAKEGEFAYLVRGGENAEFVKSKESSASRRGKL